MTWMVDGRATKGKGRSRMGVMSNRHRGSTTWP
jgi:hypothetical protein